MPFSSRQKNRSDDTDDWLITYADAVTLLLCFFVTLTAISRINVPIFEEVQSGIASELGKRDVVRPIARLEAAVQQVIDDAEISNEISITKDDVGVHVEFPSSLIFENATHIISPEGDLALTEIGITNLSPAYKNYKIEIHAHANPNMGAGKYSSLWQLTSARASSAAQLLEELGIPQSRLIAIGQAAASPKPTPKAEPNMPPPPTPNNDRLVLFIHPEIDPITGWPKK